MSEDGFDEAGMEAARRAFEREIEDSRETLRRAGEAVQVRMAEARARFEQAVAAIRTSGDGRSDTRPAPPDAPRGAGTPPER